jgi:hypothetical protein
MSRNDIAGIQMARGVPPFKFLAYSKSGDVLLLRTNLRMGSSVDIPADIRKRVAYTELKDVRGRVINRWDIPWEVEA